MLGIRTMAATVALNANPIEVNVYLAQLVSNPIHIDPLLDPMRRITARKGSDSSVLTIDERATLQNIRHKLEDYLVREEKVRSFTYDSLHQKLYEQFEAQQKISHVRLGVLLVLAFMILSIMISLVVPFGSLSQRWGLAFATSCFVGQCGTLLVFLSALSSFSTKSRQAFLLICSGIVLFSFSIILRPVLVIFYHSAVPYLKLWWIPLPWPIGYTLIYLGALKLAALFEVKGWMLKKWPTLVLIYASTLLSWWLFIRAHHAGAAAYGLAFASYWAVLLLQIMSAALMFRIAARTAAHYRSAFSWIYAALLFMAAGVAIYLEFLAMDFGNWLHGSPLQLDYPLLANIVFVVGLPVIFRAGYGLNKLNKV